MTPSPPELEHLNASFTQLRAAQAKFSECLRSIAAGVASQVEGAPLLVPLTTSLYVPGRLASKGRVVVDVGTGFFIEKVRSAFAFWQGFSSWVDGGKTFFGLMNLDETI